VPKAKELRRYVEPLITLGKNDSLANRRRAFARLRDTAMVEKLFGDLGPRFQTRPGGRGTVKNYLDGELATAYGGNKLGFIDDDHQFVTGASQNLLAQMSAAAALNHPLLGINLVGSVYGDVNARNRVDVEHINPAFFGKSCRLVRGGHRLNAQPLAAPLNQTFNKAIRRAARAETDDHPAFNPLSRFAPGRLLGFLVHGPIIKD
jgi:hypothetical protein